MRDQRLEKLGDLIVNHSCEIKKGEKVLIESSRSCAPLINYIVKIYLINTKRSLFYFFYLNHIYLLFYFYLILW